MKPQPGSLDPFFFLDVCPWLDYLDPIQDPVLEALMLVQLRPRGEGHRLKGLATHFQISV